MKSPKPEAVRSHKSGDRQKTKQSTHSSSTPSSLLSNKRKQDKKALDDDNHDSVVFAHVASMPL